MKSQKIVLTGVIVSYPEIVSVRNGKKLFRIYVDANRISNIVDRIPVTFSENSKTYKLLKEVEENKEDIVGLPILCIGEIRSYDSTKNGLHSLNNTVMSHKMKRVTKSDADINNVKVKAYISKLFDIRETPSGAIIQDCILAIPRGKATDYVPTIFWNRDAKIIHESYKVGDLVSLIGRLQSREYYKTKKDDEGNDVVEEKIRYELSVFRLNKE